MLRRFPLPGAEMQLLQPCTCPGHNTEGIHQLPCKSIHLAMASVLIANNQPFLLLTAHTYVIAVTKKHVEMLENETETR